MEAEIAKLLNHSSVDSKKLSELVEEYFYAADDSDVEDTDEGHAHSLEDNIDEDADEEEFDMRENAVGRDYAKISSSSTDKSGEELQAAESFKYVLFFVLLCFYPLASLSVLLSNGSM